MLPQSTPPIIPQRPSRDQVRQARKVLTSPDYAHRTVIIVEAWNLLRADRAARHSARQAAASPAPPAGDAA